MKTNAKGNKNQKKRQIEMKANNKRTNTNQTKKKSKNELTQPN